MVSLEEEIFQLSDLKPSGLAFCDSPNPLLMSRLSRCHRLQMTSSRVC